MKDQKANPRLHKIGSPYVSETRKKLADLLMPGIYKLQYDLQRSLSTAEIDKVLNDCFEAYRVFGWEAARRKFIQVGRRLISDGAVGRVVYR